MIDIYKKFIRTDLEYCIVAIQSSLSEIQTNALEHCWAVSIKIILQSDYDSYESALLLSGIEKLSSRRLACCKDFILKCIQHDQKKHFFLIKPNIENTTEVRDREEFVVNFARTK